MYIVWLEKPYTMGKQSKEIIHKSSLDTHPTLSASVSYKYHIKKSQFALLSLGFHFDCVKVFDNLKNRKNKTKCYKRSRKFSSPS